MKIFNRPVVASSAVVVVSAPFVAASSSHFVDGQPPVGLVAAITIADAVVAVGFLQREANAIAVAAIVAFVVVVY